MMCTSTRWSLLMPLAALCAAGLACTSATGPTPWSHERIRQQLAFSNLSHSTLGGSGRLTRWQVPIAVNTNGIARAEQALRHYEQWTGGVVRFTRVGGVPERGLVFVEGDALVTVGGRSCGLLTGTPPPDSPPFVTFTWDGSHALNGTYTIHLGSDRCDDALAGRYASSVAEHQLAHALGVIEHFDGFTNTDGLDAARLLAVVYNLYANPIGATRDELTIWSSR